MGFFDSVFSIVAELLNTSANRIDRMSDEDLEKKPLKNWSGDNLSVSEMRDMAGRAHQYYDQRNNLDDQ